VSRPIVIWGSSRRSFAVAGICAEAGRLLSGD